MTLSSVVEFKLVESKSYILFTNTSNIILKLLNNIDMDHINAFEFFFRKTWHALFSLFENPEMIINFQH